MKTKSKSYTYRHHFITFNAYGEENYKANDREGVLFGFAVRFERRNNMTKERNYGIDLLRLVLMYMVCMLHTLLHGGILEASAVGSVGHKVFWFMEVLSYCAVDSFAIISGYMATDKPKRYEKLVEMWFQAFFYSFILTVVLIALGVNHNLSNADIIKSAFPGTFRYFWYFTAFIALFFAMPVLNRFLFSVDKENAKKAFLILIVLFSIFGALGEPFNTLGGYSAIWLMVLYCIGVLAKRIELFSSRSSVFLVVLWMLCIFVSWAFYVCFGIKRLINYVSPTILLSGIIMVILFSRLRLKGTVISKLSPLAFGVYLFQLNQIIWENVLCNAFSFAAQKPIALGVCLAILCAFLLFLSGLTVEFVRSKVAKLIRIPQLSKKIAEVLDKLLNKLTVFLK